MKASRLVTYAVCGLVLACCGRAALAQDPTKVGPNIYKSILENEHVRVCEIHFKPGDKVGMHSHPDHLVYILEAGKLKLGYPDGSTKDLEGKAGDVIWIKAESHQAENVGKADVRAIVVELRDPAPKAGESTAGVAAKDDAVKVAPEAVKTLFENERVRVIESSLKPGGKLPMHGHPANVVYGITGAKIKTTLPDGKSTERDLAAGTAFWSDAIQHAIENAGPADIRALNFEFKQPAVAKKP